MGARLRFFPIAETIRLESRAHEERVPEMDGFAGSSRLLTNDLWRASNPHGPTRRTPSASAQTEERLRSIRLDGRRRYAIRGRCPLRDEAVCSGSRFHGYGRIDACTGDWCDDSHLYASARRIVEILACSQTQ